VGADGGKPSRGLVAKPKVQRVISVADATQPPHPTLSRRGRGFSNQDVRGFRDSASQNSQKKVKEAGGREGAEQPKPLPFTRLFYTYSRRCSYAAEFSVVSPELVSPELQKSSFPAEPLTQRQLHSNYYITLHRQLWPYKAGNLLPHRCASRPSMPVTPLNHVSELHVCS
jgi:hypothetical protein